MSLKAILSDLPRDRPVAVLLRHAEREPIEQPSDAASALLTPTGREAARRLGEKLAVWGSLRLLHSPVRRCAQTAAALAEGAGAAGAAVEMVGEDLVLGGPYMHDWPKVMARVLERGAGPFVRDWFAGRIEPELAVDPLVSARQQLRFLEDRLADSGSQRLTLCISHDWNVLLLCAHFLNDGRETPSWPEYLEGVAAWRDGPELVLLGHSGRRRLAAEELG